MSTRKTKSLGQVAYEAYFGNMGYWPNSIHKDTRRDWIRVARAVIRAYRKRQKK